MKENTFKLVQVWELDILQFHFCRLIFDDTLLTLISAYFAVHKTLGPCLMVNGSHEVHCLAPHYKDDKCAHLFSRQ